MYKGKSGRIDRIFGCDLERDYEMATPEAVSFPIMKLLDQIIHSHVFVEAISQTGAVEAFIVSSDRDRALGVIEVGLSEFAAIMRVAAADYPARIESILDLNSRKIVSWRGTGETPKHVKAGLDSARQRAPRKDDSTSN
jgi:hypothetical protein